MTAGQWQSGSGDDVVVKPHLRQSRDTLPIKYKGKETNEPIYAKPLKSSKILIKKFLVLGIHPYPYRIHIHTYKNGL